MTRMRTIEQAYQFLKELDPQTSLSKNALRKLIITGKLSSVRAGKKYLVNLEILQKYLRGE